jgi:Cu+-exporting ATPase
MVCPVCKNAIAMDAPKITTEYNGKTYYFASEQCKAEFVKNPEKYAACAEHEHKTVYACPMKECDYKTDKPGKCPKCGMELKEIKECLPGEHKELNCMKTCPFMKAKQEEKKNETDANKR